MKFSLGVCVWFLVGLASGPVVAQIDEAIPPRYRGATQQLNAKEIHQKPNADAAPALSAEEAPAETAKLNNKLAIVLHDGSKLLGTPTEDQPLVLDTAFGELEAKWAQIRGVLCETDVIVQMKNGDRVSGKLKTDELKFNTTFGEVSLSVKKITNIVGADETAVWVAQENGWMLITTSRSNDVIISVPVTSPRIVPGNPSPYNSGPTYTSPYDPGTANTSPYNPGTSTPNSPYQAR